MWWMICIGCIALDAFALGLIIGLAHRTPVTELVDWCEEEDPIRDEIEHRAQRLASPLIRARYAEYAAKEREREPLAVRQAREIVEAG